MAHLDSVVVFRGGGRSDWALAPPSATTMERIAKPDVSRNLCLSIMGFSSQSTPRYHINVIYLSFICQGELAFQAAVCAAAWLLIFLFLA